MKRCAEPSQHRTAAFHTSPEFGYTTIGFGVAERMLPMSVVTSAGATQFTPTATTCGSASSTRAHSAMASPAAVCTASRQVNEIQARRPGGRAVRARWPALEERGDGLAGKEIRRSREQRRHARLVELNKCVFAQSVLSAIL